MNDKVLRSLQFLTISLLSVILMLTGCKISETTHTPSHETPVENNVSGNLKVYSANYYQSSLERFFRSLNSQYPNFNIYWTNKIESADIVITDYISNYSTDEYMCLDEFSKPIYDVLIPNLIFSDSRGIVGLPLFLRVDSFWYDELLFKKTESSIPFSLESLIESPLRKEHPIVFGDNDIESVFWSVIAPMYLTYGGTVQELSSANFSQGPAKKALNYLNNFIKSGLIFHDDNPSKGFNSNSSMMWFTNIANISEIKNQMPNLSKISFAPTLIYKRNESTKIILRSDFLVVRENKDLDTNLIKIFIENIYDNQTLVNLSVDSKLPLACKIAFGYNSVPETVKTCYTILASPSLDISYLSCRWDPFKKQDILNILNKFIKGSISLEESCQMLCK